MSHAHIKTINEVFNALEDGRLGDDYLRTIKETLEDLTTQSTEMRAEKSGSVTLTLSFKVSAERVQITPQIAAKTPTAQRPKNHLFVTEDGVLSTENPKQKSLEFGENVSRLSR